MTSDVLFQREVGDLVVRVVVSERSHGDLHPLRTDRDLLMRRQDVVVGGGWSMLDQRHGRAVVEIDSDARWPIAGVGDVIVSPPTSRAAIGIWAADCAPLMLLGEGGTVVGVHAGWRGLAGAAIDVGVDAAMAGGETIVGAVLGPVIHPCCYEFAAHDLARVASGLGLSPASVRGETTSGGLALDVPAAVSGALGRRGITLDTVGPCTGCDERWFSHRIRRDVGRHAVVAWSDMLGSADE